MLNLANIITIITIVIFIIFLILFICLIPNAIKRYKNIDTIINYEAQKRKNEQNNLKS